MKTEISKVQILNTTIPAGEGRGVVGRGGGWRLDSGEAGSCNKATVTTEKCHLSALELRPGDEIPGAFTELDISEVTDWLENNYVHSGR
jgi:hypothetical protein